MVMKLYTDFVNIMWDEQKNQINIRKHGYSFADAAEIFESFMLIDLDDRYAYGENRWVGVGRLQFRVVVVIYSEPDKNTVRIISLRKALKHEREAYEQAFRN